MRLCEIWGNASATVRQSGVPPCSLPMRRRFARLAPSFATNLVIWGCFCFASAVGTNCVFAAGGISTGEWNGTLNLAFFNNKAWTTNAYGVVVRQDSGTWLIQMQGPTGQQELYSDGREAMWAAHYPENAADASLNTSMVRLFKPARPLQLRAEEHVWFALFSAAFFGPKQVPFRDIGLCLKEPGVFSEWRLIKQETSPRAARWHNEWADTAAGSTTIEGSFEWVERASGLASEDWPTMSRLRMDLLLPDGSRQPASFSELVLEMTNGIATQPAKPRLRGRSIVYDSRGSVSFEQETIGYAIIDGKLPAYDSPGVQSVAAFSGQPAGVRGQGWARPVALAGVALLTTVFALVAFRGKKRTNSKTSNENEIHEK